MAKPALRPRLTQKQIRFIREYAVHGNGTEAARRAGYKQGSAIRFQAHENLTKPHIKAALAQEITKMGLEITPQRVQRRLDEISHEAQSAGQFGPAVRAEELLGKSVGLFIDRSILLSGTMNDSHIAALIEIAKRRQQEPIDLADDEAANSTKADD